ncbi:MAG: PIN domain-containing protein [Nitrososphaera sp.]
MVFDCVLDASAFYAGTAFLSGKKCATSSAVFEEVRHIKSAALDALMDSGNLSIIDPDKKEIDIIMAAAKKTGDIAKLSQTDVSILALARQQNATLVSDDYAIANVAATIGIRIEMSSGKGIRQTRRWTSYCSACGKAFGPSAKECALCGNRLKRRYRVTG